MHSPFKGRTSTLLWEMAKPSGNFMASQRMQGHLRACVGTVTLVGPGHVGNTLSRKRVCGGSPWGHPGYLGRSVSFRVHAPPRSPFRATEVSPCAWNHMHKEFTRNHKPGSLQKSTHPRKLLRGFLWWYRQVWDAVRRFFPLTHPNLSQINKSQDRENSCISSCAWLDRRRSQARPQSAV